MNLVITTSNEDLIKIIRIRIQDLLTRVRIQQDLKTCKLNIFLS